MHLPAQVNSVGLTALDVAARSGNARMTQLLLTKGAATTAKDGSFRTAESVARRHGFNAVADLIVQEVCMG